MSADARRRRPPKLLVEALVVVGVLAGAAIGVYLGFRGPSVRNVLPLAGRNVAVTRAPRAQYDVTAAGSPARPHELFAASADLASDARFYESDDAGVTWRGSPAPPTERAPCGLSHPDVAAGPSGMVVYASLVSASCQPPDPVLHVDVRARSGARWSVHSFAPPRGFVFDVAPSVTVDATGSIYVVWPRLLGEFSSRQVLLLSRSTDGGVSWSHPLRIGRYDGVYSVDLASGAPGQLFLAVADGKRRSVDLLRSTDGGSTWSTRRPVVRLVEPYTLGCGPGSVLLPAQPQRCVGPSPSLAVGAHSLALVYSEPRANGRQGVFAVRASTNLDTIARPVPIGGAAAATSDQFLPVAALDDSDGDLWACFYDTAGDPTRKSAWFTCALSRDGGRRWSALVHASSRPGNEALDGAGTFGYGDRAGLVALDGVAHPVWTDNRNSLSTEEDVFTAAIRAPAR